MGPTIQVALVSGGNFPPRRDNDITHDPLCEPVNPYNDQQSMLSTCFVADRHYCMYDHDEPVQIVTGYPSVNDP